jgi:hypothetical protein
MAPVEERTAPPALGYEGSMLLLPADTAAELERAARRRGQSPAELIARIVRDYLRRPAGPRPPAQG